MDAMQAVSTRIQLLCSQRDISVSTLANHCGLSPSTIYSILNTKSKNPDVITIQNICDGPGISVGKFFDDDIFNDLEPFMQSNPSCAFHSRGQVFPYLYSVLSPIRKARGLLVVGRFIEDQLEYPPGEESR